MLVLSSRNICTNAETYSDAFDLCAIFEPCIVKPNDSHHNQIGCHDKLPIICLTCGGFLNPYIEYNESNGDWRCSLCSQYNPSFAYDVHSNPHKKQEYQELCDKSMHYVYHTSNNSLYSKMHNKTNTHNIFMFALDSSTCSDTDAIDLLYNGLMVLKAYESMSTRVSVSIVIYANSNIKLLHLSSLSSDEATVQIDVLPGSGEGNASLFNHFYVQGIYLTPVLNLLIHFDRVRSVVASMRPSQINRCTINSIVNLGIAMSNPSSDSVSRFHMILICTGTPAVHNPSSVAVNEIYADLGKAALAHACYIDVLHASIHKPYYDRLYALCNATGGNVIAFDSFTATSMIGSLKQLLHNSVSKCHVYPYKETIPTVEVRTSRHLSLKSLVGNVISVHDCLHYFPTAASIDLGQDFAAESLFVDADHVNHTIDSMIACCSKESSSRWFGHGTVSTIDLQSEAYRKLLCDTDLSKSFQCGLARCDPDQSISMQFKLSPSASTVDDTSRVDSSGGIVSDVKYAYIQVIFRYQSDVDQAKHVHVVTVPIEITSSPRAFIQELDPYVYSWVMCKSIIAEYSHNCQTKYGGAISNVSSADRLTSSGSGRGSDSNDHSLTLRDECLQYIDGLVAAVANFWLWNNDTRSKFDVVFRCCFHLREGPLLDGPALYGQEAFLLRSHVLCAKWIASSSLAYITPIIYLTYFNTFDGALSMMERVVPDYMALIPRSIAVIDYGDTVVVRSNSYNFIDVYPDVFATCVSHANDIAHARYPSSVVHTLHNPWSPSDRSVFSRLNPSCRDRREVQLSAISQIANLTKDEIDEMVSNMPVTDQLSYENYLQVTIPAFMKARYQHTKQPTIETMGNDITPGNTNSSSNNSTYSLINKLFTSSSSSSSSNNSNFRSV